MNAGFFVYEHWRPDKDVCFYVGKGKRKRVFLMSRKENIHHTRVCEKLARLGMCLEIRLVESGLTEDQAFAAEIARIAFWRGAGVKITNQTHGGEGASGCIRSLEFKANLSALHKGVPKPHFAGRRLTDEHRAKISPRGRIVSSETRQKISASQKGRHRPELVGRKLSPEGIERLRNRVFTDEHRRKISETKRARNREKAEQHLASLDHAP